MCPHHFSRILMRLHSIYLLRRIFVRSWSSPSVYVLNPQLHQKALKWNRQNLVDLKQIFWRPYSSFDHLHWRCYSLSDTDLCGCLTNLSVALGGWSRFHSSASVSVVSVFDVLGSVDKQVRKWSLWQWRIGLQLGISTFDTGVASHKIPEGLEEIRYASAKTALMDFVLILSFVKNNPVSYNA